MNLIITAGGTGSRFGNTEGKQFTLIENTAMVVYTAKKFLPFKDITKIIFTIDKLHVEKLEAILEKENFNIDWTVMPGGVTRYDSVKGAFSTLSEDTDYVLIHDGARPYISSDLLQRSIDAVKQYNAVIPGVPVVDTVKQVDEDGFVKQTLQRSELKAVQTPQCFAYGILKKAYEACTLPPEKITDDAMMVEMAGFPIKVIEGEVSNSKVTYATDVGRSSRR
jgi:2-C-methyl-D-erythritol 4-phosphate cytidylyltransferase